jgi:hypothetical protein
MSDPEGEALEFKSALKNYQFDKIVEYCLALANEGGGKIVRLVKVVLGNLMLRSDRAESRNCGVSRGERLDMTHPASSDDKASCRALRARPR